MMALVSRIRFLPLTIFAASLMLTVRVSDIWQGVEGLATNTLKVAQATAQTTDGQEPQSLTPDLEAGAAGSEQAASLAGETGNQSPIEPTEVDPLSFLSDEVAAEAERIAAQDPTLMTEEEIALLQQLSKRRAEIEARERDVEQRFGLLEAAETRIDDKINQLKRFQETIESLIVTYDEQQEKKTASLVRIYENMKPKDAARIFEDLETDTLLLVAERMKERKLASVMANMSAEKARAITVELSRLRNLPGEPGLGG